MRFQQYGENKGKALVLICTCMIWLVSACSGNPGQLVNSTARQTHVQGTPTSDSGSGQGVTIQLPRQYSTPGAKPGATATPTNNQNPPPGPLPQGQGGIPA